MNTTFKAKMDVATFRATFGKKMAIFYYNISGQSYKASTIVIYDSRGII